MEGFDVLVFLVLVNLLKFTDASVTGTKVSWITPRIGSYNGDTMVTVVGKGFSQNHFESEDTVSFVSSTRSYDCKVDKDNSHDTQIGCFTSPMVEDDYFVRVSVNGKDVPLADHCRSETDFLCRFKPILSRTPTISLIEPSSASPGSVIKISGWLMTSRVFSTEDKSTNGRTQRIRHIYIGKNICELKKNANTNELYGIQLKNGGWSVAGWLKCRITGSSIGNQNVSFVIEGDYGRSKPDLKTLRLSNSDEIYMLQTYAVIESISPADGSTVGGTEIEITGNFFNQVKSKARVYVGGEPCEITKPVTTTKITCRTPVQQNKEHYSGNRGAKAYFWRDKKVWKSLSYAKDNMRIEDRNYDEMRWYDGSGFVEHSDEQTNLSGYAARTRGWFTPPRDGDYVFYWHSNDGGAVYFSETGNITEMTEVASCPSYCQHINNAKRGYDQFQTQISKKFTLSAKKRYYFETFHVDNWGAGYSKLGIKYPKTKYVNTETFDADNEKQTIQIKSSVRLEKQVINFQNWATQTGVDEVQEIVISGNSNGKFRFSYRETFTDILEITSSGSDIATALKNIPTLGNVDVTKTSTSSDTNLVITFYGDLGDIPNLSFMSIPANAVNIIVTEKTKGVPSLNKVYVEMNNVPSPGFSITASESQVTTALWSMFSVRCPPKLDGSMAANNIRQYHISFEKDDNRAWEWGTAVNDSEPFCGRTSLGNPKYLFFADNGKYFSVLLAQYKYICFAYKGSFRPKYDVRFSSKTSRGLLYNRTVIVDYEFNTDITKWHYDCIDVLDIVMKDMPDNSQHKLLHIQLYPLRPDQSFIDEVEITKLVTVESGSRPDVDKERQLPPRNILMKDIKVNKTDTSTYEISLNPYNCANNFPAFSVTGSQVMSQTASSVKYNAANWPSNVMVEVVRDIKATGPVAGSFALTYYGVMKEIPADMTSDQLTAELQSVAGMGQVDVERTGTCAGYNWTISWTNIGGDQPTPILDGSKLSGNDVSVSVLTDLDGGLIYGIIPGEMISSFEAQPQVVVYINDIPTACTGNCTFMWTSDKTPVVTNVQPTSGTFNTDITITGTNLLGVQNAPDSTMVKLGGGDCSVQTHTDTQIVCRVGEGALGTYQVKAIIAGKGNAKHDGSMKQFSYSGSVTSLSPTQGSRGGGTFITIEGSGFSKDSTVTVGGLTCPVLSYNFTQLTCTVPPKPTNNSDTASVVVMDPAGNLNSPTDFSYSSALTPVVDSVNATSSSVKGGEILEITGSQLKQGGPTTVTLCGTVASVIHINTTTIHVIIPPNKPGMCQLLIDVQGSGNAASSSSGIPSLNYILSVSAVYPLKGSAMGGTHITINGQGFPAHKTDVKVTVGKHTMCNVTEISANKVVCTMGSFGKVHTVSNTGSNSRYGPGYEWEPSVFTLEEGDSLSWKWTFPQWLKGTGSSIIQVHSPINTAPVEGGFTNGIGRTQQGIFKETFNVAGTYYYSSGIVNEVNNISMMGTIIVIPRADVQNNVKVEVAGFEADNLVNSGVSITPSGSCIGLTSPINNCTMGVQNDNAAQESFNYTASICHTPTVTSISPNEVYPGDPITITGTGFGSNLCENEVMIGKHNCVIDSSLSTSITCHIDITSKADIYKAKPVTLRAQNRGHALIQIQDYRHSRIIIKPYFDSIAPNKGSVAGGTYVTITGAGFKKEHNTMSVSMNGKSCAVKSLTYNQIVCETGMKAESTGAVVVTFTVAGVPPNVMCRANNCDYSYLQNRTTTVTNVSPTMLSGFTNDITILGDFNIIEANDTTITIGGVVCEIKSKTGSNIVCTANNIISGSHKLMMHVKGQGSASIVSGDTITVEGNITAISPVQGSLNGKTKLTITGGVFNNDASTTVIVGTSSCMVESISFGSIICITPARTNTGQFDVSVVSNGNTLTSAHMFEYSDTVTPTVTAISPASASGSVTLTLTGTKFSTTNGDNIINIGSQSCVTTQSGVAELQCSLPELSAGSYQVDVIVNNKGRAAVNAPVTVRIEPTLTAVSPTAGSFGGGQLLTITGKSLASANSDTIQVSICGQPCKVISFVVGTVECLTPENLGSGTVQCDVHMTVNLLNASLSPGYQYDSAKTPVVSDIQPRRGGTGGGTKITITGSKFGSNPSAINVTIAGVPCDVSISTTTSTKVECVTNGISLTTKTKVQVAIEDYGIADQTNADFEYIDMWSSRWTWGGGSIPVEGDFVVIKENQTILLDTDTPVLKMILIKGGSLIFDDKDLKLNAERILVTHGGHFQVGTEDSPYMHKAIITIHGNVRSTQLPVYGAKVLAIREGTLDLHGRPTPVTWTRLATTAIAGSTQLSLKVPVNWFTGDSIVIPTTNHRHSQKETEIRTITAVSSDGLTLTIDKPLNYDHISVQETIGGHVIELRGEVGLLSHNIIFRGSNDSQWNDKIEECEKGFNTGEFSTQTCFQGRFGDAVDSDQFGAHIMLHTPSLNSGTLKAKIEYIEVAYAGQAFNLGRYPIHFHLLGNMNGSYVRGCAIHDTFNRAVNIHGTHNVLIEHNVIYNIMGGAYFLEDGIETGNIFQYNLAVFVISSTSLLNDDITPASFWVTNPNNIVRHNAAAGGTHFGFWYRMHKHPDGPSYNKNICPINVPLGEFYNNTAHSFGWFGVWIFQDYFPKVDGKCGSSSMPTKAVFKNLTAWHNEKGAECVDCGDVIFEGSFFVSNEKAGYEGKLVTTSRPYQEDGPMFSDSVIVGHTSISKADECTTQGVVLPFGEGFSVRRTTFINFDRSNCQALGVTSVDGTCSFGCGGYYYLTSGLNFIQSPRVIKFRWSHEAVLKDEDGTLIGTAGQILAPHTDILPPGKCTEVSKHSLGVKAVQCDSDVHLIRFAFNHPVPASVKFKDAIFVNEHGSTHSPWLDKRLTHKQGWMSLLSAGSDYKMYFEDADHVTNVSYDGGFSNIQNGDYLMITNNVSVSPDRISVFPGDSRKASTTPLSSNSANGDFFYNAMDKTVSYMVSRKPNNNDFMQSNAVKVQIAKCYYVNCTAPKDPNDIPPTEGRPDNFDLWSSPSTWQKLQVSKPVAGDDVTVPKGMWLVVDEPLPRLNKVNISGALEFENATKANGEYHNIQLRANYIFITGRFVIGWPNYPFKGQAEVILEGRHSSPPFDISQMNSPNIGAKAMAVYGGLDFHGKMRTIHWTELASTATVGSPTITVKDTTNWQIGDEIVLTTTSYNVWQTETFKITSISDKVISLNATIQHKHLGKTYIIPNATSSRTIYTIKAKVGLLTHNIKIKGSDYSSLYKEAFGARVLIGSMSQKDKAYTGYARLTNVEFVHTGQEGFTDFYDPRFSLAFLDVGQINDIRPSHVTGCSFHNGFSTAIGVFGTENLLVQNNVVHHTINHGIKVWGSKNYVISNLVALVLWPGSYYGRKESTNFYWSAGIESTKANVVTVRNNVVSGSQRSGYNIKGEDCTVQSPLFQNNEAYGSLVGVLIMPDYALSSDCLRVSGFNIHKGYDYGIYIQGEASIKIDNVLLVDNGVGIFPMVLGPHILSHVKSNKFVHISKSTVIGTSPHFDCGADVIDSDNNFNFSLHARSFRSKTNGPVGMSFPNFISKTNNAPKKPWTGLMSYPAIGGIMTVTDTHFADFKTYQCTGSSARTGVMLSGNPSNDDAMHPVTTRRITFGNVVPDGWIFIPRPNVGKVNPADCVDMDCDGAKKAILKDLDGSWLGPPLPVAAIPHAEFEWDGDRRRGVGDYRIPKVMFTDKDGNRLQVSDVAPHKGIIRNNQCLDKTNTWHAYVCHDINYEMLIIESMDKDTEHRRISPIALLGDGYVDLINGPQDMGWCDGYTCQQRVSTFYAIIATGYHFDIYLSSTNPQQTRFYLLNVDDNIGVRLAVYYASPNRLDIYRNGEYIPPTNSILHSNGDRTLQEPTTPNQYVPPLNSTAGTNYFDSIKKMQYIMVGGADTIDIITSPKVVLSFSLPALTVDQFFDGANIVRNLAVFLGISPNKIKVVKIVRANAGRKKRASEATVEIEISDNPVQSIQNSTENEINNVRNEMVNISNVIVSATQLGTLGDQLNITMLKLKVVEPLPATDDPAWKDVAQQLNDGVSTAKDVSIPASMTAEDGTSTGVEGAQLNSVPVLHVLDNQMNHVSLLGSTSDPWEITAMLKNGTNPGARLIGKTTMTFQNGYANFTDLGISHTGSGYMIEFMITKPVDANFLVATIGPITITGRTLSARTVSMATSVVKATPLNITLEIIEATTGNRAVDINWKGHVWECTVSLNDKTNYPGQLTATKVTVGNDSVATFDVQLSHVGRAAFTFDCVTSPASSYSFTVNSKVITVIRAVSNMPQIAANKALKVKFSADYNRIVGDEEMFIALVDNYLTEKYSAVLFDGYTLQRGSIIVNFWINGTVYGVDTAISDLWNTLKSTGVSLTFGNLTVNSVPYMSVDGNEQTEEVEKAEDEGLKRGILIGIGIAVGIVVIAIILLVLWILHKPAKKVDNVSVANLQDDCHLKPPPSYGSALLSTVMANETKAVQSQPSANDNLSESDLQSGKQSTCSGSQIVVVPCDKAPDTDILGRTSVASGSNSNTVGTSLGGSIYNNKHPFGMENEPTGQFEGTGQFVTGSRPGSRNAALDQGSEPKKVLEDVKVVMDYMSKNTPQSQGK